MTSRKEKAIGFIVIGIVLLNAPRLAPLLTEASKNFTERTYFLLMAGIHFLPGLGLIFLVLGIYRYETKGKEEKKRSAFAAERENP